MRVQVFICPRCRGRMYGRYCRNCEPREAQLEFGHGIGSLLIYIGVFSLVIATGISYTTAPSGRAIVYHWHGENAPAPPELEVLREYARLNDLSIAGTYSDELVDGKLANRNVPGLVAAVNALGENDALLVPSQDVRRAIGGPLPISPEDARTPDPYADPLVLSAGIAGKGVRTVVVERAARESLLVRLGGSTFTSVLCVGVILFGVWLRRVFSDRPRPTGTSGKRRRKRRRTA